MRNHRPLERITVEIHRAERSAVFACGKLLLEAQRQLHHGEWTKYLTEIDWHPRTAQLYMKVARLAAKTKSISHLNAAPTALFQLAWIADNHPNCLALAIKRLKASVARKDSALKQRESVFLTPEAKAAPGHTDIALRGSLDAINSNCFGDEKRSAAMGAQASAILQANPKTEEELAALVKKYPIPLPARMSEAANDEDHDGAITSYALLIRKVEHLDPNAIPLTGLDANAVAKAAANLEILLKRLRGNNVVKLVADRAQARSRK